jgi:hypothetical protein
MAETTNRTPFQIIHNSLQEWNSDEFVELNWNSKATAAILKGLEDEGYVVVKPAKKAYLPI